MTGSGPWYWNCSGSNGGTNAACTAYVTPTGAVPSCNISPSAASIVDGTSQTFTASCTNSPLGYQWKVDGNFWSLGGAGPTSFDIFAGLAVGAHTVSVTANNSTGTSGPVSAILTVTSAVPSCSISPATASIASGATQVFTANCTNSPNNYQWVLDGALVGSGSINSYGTGTNLAVGLHTVTVTTSNAGGPSVATSASLTINSPTASAAPVISSAGTASGTMNAAFSYPITASNSPTSYGASGLPAGVSVNTNNGVISGKPRSPHC